MSKQQANAAATMTDAVEGGRRRAAAGKALSDRSAEGSAE